MELKPAKVALAPTLDGWAIGSLVCAACGWEQTVIFQVADQSCVLQDCDQCGRRTARYRIAFPVAQHAGYFESTTFAASDEGERSFERES